VVIMTSRGDERVAVQAIKAGALDYVVKSAEELDHMPRVAERALREWGHIMERRRVEEALGVSERRFRALIEQSPIGTIVYRPDGSLRYGNPAGIKLWGVSEEAYQTLLLGYNVLEDEQLAAIGSMDFI
jgi:PAS domain-containing protein